MMTPSIAPPVPSIPACDLLSQPSGKGQIQEIIEPSPEQDLLDLQLSQRPISGPSEQVPPRRNERICLQHDNPKWASFKISNQERYWRLFQYSYKINEDNHENQEFDCDSLAISAEPVEENDIDRAFSTQDLISLTNIYEALQDPIRKQSMDNEYGALINKKYGMSYYCLLTQILQEAVDSYLQTQSRRYSKG